MVRPCKPSELKKLEGNRAKVGKARITVDVKGFGMPVAPHSLTASERRLWDAIVASLPAGILSAADVSALERHVLAWERFRTANEACRKEGMVVVSAQGRVRSPWVNILRDASAEMERTGASLGLSPAARAKLVGPNEHDDGDDLMDLLIGGAEKLREIWPTEPPEQTRPTRCPKLVHARKA